MNRSEGRNGGADGDEGQERTGAVAVVGAGVGAE